ncbi:unnamed protein product [Acanthoscelides obtectus]|uniref:Uncharacterized protein n=1 Tax=Acanthoscelides obtectus TaxID=200917 RepID=A0A9P0PIW2_ACAOB|nr:unnamed protein product [Acanthoscelides obtectus]CAK1661730.1 hypothetical protein AOBTE_LOCUS22759 [Acanthoscelides obtectus]
METLKEKTLLTKVVSGKLVKKYKLWRMEDTKVINYRRVEKEELLGGCVRKNKISRYSVRAVVDFFEDDFNSRLGAGKKKFITRKKERKQKRYILRTFWIVVPKVDRRHTCLCITYANIDLKLSALYNARILKYNNYQKLIQELCCDRYHKQYLSKQCQDCLNKTPLYREFNNRKTTIYKKWTTEKQDFVDLKKTRQVTKYIKKPFTVKPRSLILELHEDLEKFLCPERNIVHQFCAIKKLKQTLTEEDVLIHIDFSENYSTKYRQEIQAYRFGGSRAQISLHIVVMYFKDTDLTVLCLQIFHILRLGHLKPNLKSLPPLIENVHFLSDGPVTQYRNKTMFYITATKLTECLPNVHKFTWNYTETGHGKGGFLWSANKLESILPKLFSDMEDADYYIQAAKRLQKKNNGYK